jgi:hypothetical protein
VPFVTVLAVLEVPAVGIPDDDDELLDNVVGILGDGGRTATFVTVTRGVSRAALDAGACVPDEEPEEDGRWRDPGREDFHSDG